jgi:hypothetical protein
MTTGAWDLPTAPPAEATSESLLGAFLSTRTVPPSKPVFGAIVTGRHAWHAGRKSRKASRWATIRGVVMCASTQGSRHHQPAGRAGMRGAPSLTHTRVDVGVGPAFAPAERTSTAVAPLAVENMDAGRRSDPYRASGGIVSRAEVGVRAPSSPAGVLSVIARTSSRASRMACRPPGSTTHATT